MKIVELYDAEGLVQPKARFYEIAAYASNQMGDVESAKRYGELAVKAWGIVAGRKSVEVQMMRELVQDPERHASYGHAGGGG